MTHSDVNGHEAIAARETTEVRLAMLRNGYKIIKIDAPDLLMPTDPRHDPQLGKKPFYDNWTALDLNEQQIVDLEPSWREFPNTGILATTVVGFDFDINDAEVARTALNFAIGYFPDTHLLVRYGRRPRFLIPFRCDAPFGKIVEVLNEIDGKAGDRIEILADGQQFIAAGLHPQTWESYQWENGSPWTVHRNDLPLIDEKGARVFVDKLLDTIEGHHPGFITKTRRRRLRDAGDDDNVVRLDEHRIRLRDWRKMPIAYGCSLDLQDYNATSFAEIRAACNAIEGNTLGHDRMVEIGYGLLDELGIAGHQFFESLPRAIRRPRKIAKTWMSIVKSAKKGTSKKPVTIGTLFHYAKKFDEDWRDKIEDAPLHPMEMPRDESAWVSQPVPEDAPITDLKNWRPDPDESSIGDKPDIKVEEPETHDEVEPATDDEAPKTDSRSSTQGTKARQEEARGPEPGPKEKAKEKPKVSFLDSLLQDTGDLQHKKFDPLKWIVPKYLPEGLTLLVGRPKVGKSFLALDIGVAVKTGGQCLGQQCVQGDVLGLFLEDNDRRLQRRLTTMLGVYKEEWPRIKYATVWPRLVEPNGPSGLKLMRQWVNEVENPRLIIVDVLARVRQPTGKGQTAYEADYNALSSMHDLAGEFGISILVLHHDRKAAADDPFDTVSGTLGQGAAADTTLLLKREQGKKLLMGRGRDLDDGDFSIVVEQDKKAKWSVLGDADDVLLSAERAAIVKVLKKMAKPMSPTEIALATKMKVENVKVLLGSMLDDGVVKKTGYGAYEVPF